MKLTKLFKNLLCAFAAVSLTLFTVSCGGGDDAAAPDGDAAPAEPAADAAPAEPAADAPAADAGN